MNVKGSVLLVGAMACLALFTAPACDDGGGDDGPGEPYSEHGHYINMTNTAYTEVACGFYTTPDGAVWAVQDFR